MCAAHSGLGQTLAWFSFIAADATERPAAGQGRRLPCCVAGRTCCPATTRADDGDPQRCHLSPDAAGLVFDWHTHDDHQLAWAASGVLTVRTEASPPGCCRPPGRCGSRPGCRTRPCRPGPRRCGPALPPPPPCPVSWPEPTPVAATPLLAELIGYLENPGLARTARHGRGGAPDQLEPVAMTPIEVRLPADERAREVAQALATDPADGRTLGRMGPRGRRQRAHAGTGLSRQNRRSLRPVARPSAATGGDGRARHRRARGAVARRVGYESTSAFVAAFRRETGVTPAVYFRIP